MLEELNAALEKHGAIHGYHNETAHILKGEIDALDPPYEGAGATVAGTDELIDWIEGEYGVTLEKTREKRQAAAGQEERMQHGG